MGHVNSTPRKVLSVFVALAFLLALGCAQDKESTSEEESASAEEVIDVGAVLPLTGSLAAIGAPEKNMLNLAVERLNENKNDDYRYTLTVEDSNGEGRKGATAAAKLIDVDEVDVMFVSLTRVAKSVIPIAERAEVPVIANSLSTGLTSLGENVFRFFPSTTNETSIWLEEVKTRGYDKVGYLYVNSGFAVEERKILSEKLGQRGKSLVAESYEKEDKDFRAQLLKMERAGVDALIISGLGLNYVTIMRQMKELGLNVPVLGDFDFGLAFAQNAAMETDDGLGFYDGVVFTRINVEQGSEKLQRVRDAYSEKYSGDIMDESEAIFFYDAMLLVGDIIANMESFSTQALIEEMANTDVIRGVSGEFQISGRSADIPLQRAEFVQGEIVEKETTASR
jgi:branched-chain amino acid transport system substrate-binding protein